MVIRQQLQQAFLVVGLALPWVVPFGVWAQADTFEVTAATRFEAVDNPEQETDFAAQIRENQWRGILGVNGVLQGSFTRFEADSTLEVRRFSRQEEQNHELVLGTAALQLGTENSRLLGELSHSADEILIDPKLGDTEDNLDRRSISTAQGYVRFGRAVNRLSLMANAAEVQFDTHTQNESSQVGGGLFYDRALNPIMALGLELSGYTLDYREPNLNSLDYRRAAVALSTQLRRLSYDLHLGTNSVDDGSMRRSPFYELNINYDNQVNRIAFEARQWLTDTSQGSGNSESFVSSAGLDGRLTVVDQFTRRDAALSWRSLSVCQRCILEVSTGMQREDYRRQKLLDTHSRLGSVAFAYTPRKNWTLRSGYSYTAVAFTAAEGGDYQQGSWRAAVEWANVRRYGRFSLYAESMTRTLDTEVADGFTRSLVGLAFDYSLYRR